MKLNLRQFDPSRRSAFTLVELLVVVAIFAILTTLTVSAFTGGDVDRIGQSSATLKNAIQGARSRAIQSKEVRGLRLLLDPSDNHIVTSAVYVGAPSFHTGTVNVVWISGTGWRFGESSPSAAWDTLDDRDLIKNGARIEVPADSGHWYTITGFTRSASPTPAIIDIAEHFQPSRYDPSAGPNFWQSQLSIDVDTSTAAFDIPFRLELAPTVLDGADPINFEANVCIDLDASIVPWRNGSGTYNQPMDILFTPKGVLVGDLASEGITHLMVADVGDVILAQAIAGRPTANANPVVPRDPEKPRKIVSIFSATGGLVTSDVFTDGDSDGVFNNETIPAGTAYRFAITGKEAR